MVVRNVVGGSEVRIERSVDVFGSPGLLAYLSTGTYALRKCLFGVTAALLIFGSWALSSPYGSDPDSNFHLTSIWCANGYQAGVCEEGSPEFSEMDPPSVRVPNSVGLAGYCFSYEPNVSASCEVDVARSVDMYETRSNNASGLYPNGYYRFMNLFRQETTTQSVLIFRLMNILLFVLLAFSVLILTDGKTAISWMYGVAASCVPLFLFTLTSSNPSSWALIGVGTYWVFLYAIFQTRARLMRTLQVCGALVSASLAISSRSDAAIYVGISSFTIPVLVWLRNRTLGNRRMLLIPAAISLIVFVIATGVEQTAVVSEGMFGTGSQDRGSLHIAMLNFFRLPAIPTGVFGFTGAGGELGWLDTKMPEGVSIFSLFVFAGLLTWSWQGRRGLSRGVEIAHLILPVLIPFFILQLDNAYVGENVQGRYVLPLIPAALSISILGRLNSGQNTLSGNSLRIMGALLSVAHGVALHVNIRRYVTGLDVNGINLTTNAEWWWPRGPSPMWTWAIGSTSFAVFVILVLPNLWKLLADNEEQLTT